MKITQNQNTTLTKHLTIYLKYIYNFFINIIYSNMESSEEKQQQKNIVLTTFIRVILKYALEGLIIAIAAYYIPLMYKTSLKTPTFNEIFSIGLTASLTMIVLDFFSKQTATGVRFGAGLGIGKGLVSL